MGIVQLSNPGKVSEDDWAYYLQFKPSEFLQNISNSLKTENRYLVDERFQRLIFQYAFDSGSRWQAQQELSPWDGMLFYRARIYRKPDAFERLEKPESYGDFQGFDRDVSFVAPANKYVGQGRANPDNIRYLYTSSDVETSLLEVRCRPGENVSVAEIQLLDRVILFNIADNYSSIDTDDDTKWHWINGFVLALSGLFQRPYSETGDYYLCQYICEYLKNWGLDGIMYRSAQNRASFGRRGVNYIFFNYEKCEVVSSKLYRILSIDIKTYPEFEESNK